MPWRKFFLFFGPNQKFEEQTFEDSINWCVYLYTLLGSVQSMTSTRLKLHNCSMDDETVAGVCAAVKLGQGCLGLSRPMGVCAVI